MKKTVYMLPIIAIIALSLIAQSTITRGKIRQYLTGLSRALEAYRVDENGYPASLDLLSPVYVKRWPEGFLQTIDYSVKRADLFEGASQTVYRRFKLIYLGADGKRGTEDDVVIDTHKVMQQPEGFGLKEFVIKPDLPPPGANDPVKR